MLKRNGIYGLAEVYVRCQNKGYARSFESMCRQICKCKYRKSTIHRKSYTKFANLKFNVGLTMRKKWTWIEYLNQSMSFLDN